MIARIAALSGERRFDQTVTFRVRSGLAETLACVSSCVPASQPLVKYGGERGIRTPDTAFDRITV